jgi:hypothetical protein
MIVTHSVRQRLTPYTTVPYRLLAACLIVAVGALLVWYAITLAVQGARHGVQTIGQDTAPSIFAAQRIRSRLADLHAEAANDLLAGGLGNAASRHAYTEDLQQVAAALVRVAKNVTYAEEFPPIIDMQKWLVIYTGLIEEARTETRHGNPVGAAFLRRADQLLQMQLLQAAQQLDAINRQYLETQYTTRARWAWIAMATVIVLGLALSLGLLWQHRYVRRLFRRRYNLGLLSASGLTLGLTVYVVWSLWASHIHLRTAKQDAFDSVYALLRLRAEANQAKAVEALWLLANGGGQSYVQRWQTNTQRILDPAITTQLVAAGWESTDGQRLRAHGKTSTVHTLAARRLAGEAVTKKRKLAGFLGDALANITYSGEGESATEILVWYVHYMALDSLIRALDSAGRHWEAVALCVGTQEGQSNGVFNQLDQAINTTLTINFQGFESLTARAAGVLQGLDGIAPATLLLVVLCTVVGLWPRIAEFR